MILLMNNVLFVTDVLACVVLVIMDEGPDTTNGSFQGAHSP